MALCICIVPSFSAVLGYMYVLSRQVTSMAKSGLLPSIFKNTFGPNRTPIFGMIFVSCFGILGLTYSWAENPYTTTSRFSTLAGCIIYLAMFVCYIIFNTRFSNLERSFRNPLGMVSAVLGIMIFGAVFIIMLALNLEFYPVTAMFFGYLSLMTLYYYAYAETYQVFSASEQKVFFKAYIVNMKRRKTKNFLSRMWTDFLKLLACCTKKALMKVRVYASETSDSRVPSDSRGSNFYSSDRNNSESHNSGGDSKLYENESERPESIISNNIPPAELPECTQNATEKMETNKTATSFSINFRSLRQSSSLKLTGILNGSSGRSPTNATNPTTIPVRSSAGSGKDNKSASPVHSRGRKSSVVTNIADGQMTNDIECGGVINSSTKDTMKTTINCPPTTPPYPEDTSASQKQPYRKTDEEILEHEDNYLPPGDDDEMMHDDQVSMMHLPCDDFISTADHDHEHDDHGHQQPPFSQEMKSLQQDIPSLVTNLHANESYGIGSNTVQSDIV
jgi:hypothetical protein